MESYLISTYTIDCEEKSVKQQTQTLTNSRETTIEKPVTVFYFVRDQIKYNPYVPLYTLDNNRASATLFRGEGYCVQKAILMTALVRAAGIPACLGFADIRNYIVPEKIAKAMKGNNLFIYHGYVVLYVDGRWVKATPTFDIKMCEENSIIPVEFNGGHDAQFHRYNKKGKLHIEYVQDHGYYDDLPWEQMCEARTGHY